MAACHSDEGGIAQENHIIKTILLQLQHTWRLVIPTKEESPKKITLLKHFHFS